MPVASSARIIAQPREEASLKPEPAPQTTTVDRRALLFALAPLPTDALVVVYALEGFGEITGRVEILARPGGFRRENWAIQIPVDSGAMRRLAGSTIQTPEGVWIEGPEGATFRPSPLGPLADAWLALAEADRQTALDRVHTYRQAMARARAEDPSPFETILGIPCHSTHVDTIEMCVWEATGLPLRYESEGLRLRAIHIDQAITLGAHAFDPPSEPYPSTDSAEPMLDAPGAIQHLLDQDLTLIGPYLHPGLRPPPRSLASSLLTRFITGLPPSNGWAR